MVSDIESLWSTHRDLQQEKLDKLKNASLGHLDDNLTRIKKMKEKYGKKTLDIKSQEVDIKDLSEYLWEL